ncbi:MAG: hypothetical protein HS105_05960 [Chloracidobacterium sp.]|nr:hypothetical protein [Chloracidobacterium sp.]
MKLLCDFRRELDNIIFDALGLTNGERDAVYEAVIDLVSRAPPTRPNDHELNNTEALPNSTGDLFSLGLRT